MYFYKVNLLNTSVICPGWSSLLCGSFFSWRFLGKVVHLASVTRGRKTDYSGCSGFKISLELTGHLF